MTLNVVILAAGMGTRMKSDLPKVLHKVAGRPMLAHVIATARELAPRGICVVYGHGGEHVQRVMAGSGLTFAHQEKQLGTGHAVRQALPFLADGATTLVLYGDVPLIRAETLKKLAEGAGLRVLTAILENPKGYGRIVRNRSGNVTRIVEEEDATPAQRRITEINTGIMAIPTERLSKWLEQVGKNNAAGEYYLTDLIALAVKDRAKVTTVRADDPDETLGVNRPAELANAERLYQRREAERLMDNGVRLADPARLDVRGTLHCGKDVSIDVNSVFEGDVRLADRVEIGPHCVLRNVTVGAGTHIAAYTHIDDAELGENCRIGPYARIRPGTHLAAEVHIGNFVEIKASLVGQGSKANHLTYVGDATVGRNVNLGAGTITCNYDGADKHRTVIEDDVHIGSDVQLVAPVTLAKGVTVGAGTTVWRNTPPGGLVINAKTQEHRAAWQRPRKNRPK